MILLLIGTMTLQGVMEVGWCPSRVRLSPTGDLALVVLNDDHGTVNTYDESLTLNLSC
jgi:hypothetical protein